MINVTLNYKAIVRLLGIIILIAGIAMSIPWIYAEVAGYSSCVAGFRIGTLVSVFVGLVLTLALKSDRARFRLREGYIVVASCWAVAILAGSIPYYFSAFTDSYFDAIFESTSGFTTTGCSSVGYDNMPNPLLLWKAITNWLGGMGILVFAISILPALGINGQFIVRAEAPGPAFQKTAVRMSDSAKVLYITYLAFTVVEFLLLFLSGKMPLFDAIVTTLGSVSTGGLTAHPEGIAFYDSIYVELVISAFCILSSVNYVLYHYLATGKGIYLVKDVELRAFLIIILSAIIICTMGLVIVNGQAPGPALRDAGFEVVSMATTAGYMRSQYIVWPVVCQITLIALMFIGGCSSSTSGSIKVIRILVMLKLVFRGSMKRIHPRSVVAVKFGKTAVSAPIVSAITAFILTYCLMLLVSVFVLSFQGFSMETTITAALAMLSNTGAAFGDAAAAGNFSMFHPLLKLYLSALMIMGRLELFTIMILFSKSFWSRNH